MGEPLSETTKVTVLREGMNVGPARTQLFRTNPTTFAEACRIALNEDASQRKANVRGGYIESTTSGPTPMDISATELARFRQQDNVTCFKCGRRGHYARTCYVQSKQQQPSSFQKQQRHSPGNGRARFRKRFNRNGVPPRNQGNVHTR